MERKGDRTVSIVSAMAPMLSPDPHTFQTGDVVRSGNAKGAVIRVISSTEVEVQWTHLPLPRRELGERLTKSEGIRES